MKLKKYISILCAATLLCGCTPTSDQTTFTGEEVEKPVHQDNLNAISPQAYSSAEGITLEPGTYISIIGKNTEAPYWETVAAGVEQAAADINAEMGYTGDDKIKVVYSAPELEEDIDEQVNILDEELSRYPDAIGIACIDNEAYATQFDQATENGIPIIAFDSGTEYKGVLCVCRTDNVEAAQTGASKLFDEIGNSGQVILLVHDSMSTSAAERLEGFQAELESHPDIEVVETLYYDQMQAMKKTIAEEKNLSSSGEAVPAEDAAEKTAATPEDEGTVDGAEASEAQITEAAGSAETQKSTEDTDKIWTEDDITDEDVLQYYLEKHPEVKGIFGSNDFVTEWAVESLREVENEDIVLMGFDAGETLLTALENGEVDGLVVQNPFGMGYAAVIAAARTILEIGNEAEVDTGYIWVTKEKLNETSIQNMLYR